MTVKKDLKRRIRERQERTGESYVVARRAVLAEREESPAVRGSVLAPSAEQFATPHGAIVVVEMDDVSVLAAELGLRCAASITRRLAERVDARTALARFREVLYGTLDDPAMERMQAVALRGEAPGRFHVTPIEQRAALKRFEARVRLGIGGLNETGTMLACPVEAVMMICHLGFGIVAQRQHERPRLVLATDDAVRG